ncbi:flippase [Sphingomonas sp. GB1N7]|uniref:flippase n=1 Tax=Parasphingomonas caseinilytica TaxID=3096158 RepID=UPI002FC8B4F9
MSTKRDTAYNLLGAALPVAVSLATVPAYLHAIGEVRFGFLAIVWLFLGYFGLFDLGLGMATSHHLAAASKDADEERAQLVWSALITNSAIGMVGGLILWPIATYYFAYVMKTDPAMRLEMMAAVPWLALGVPLVTITGVLGGALQGLNRFGRLNTFSAGGTLLFQILPLLAALLVSPRLTVVLPVALLARVVTLLLLWFEVRRVVLRGHRATYSRQRMVSMLKFGGWVTLSSLFSPLMSGIDRFAIGAGISAGAVSYFSVPYSLSDRSTIIANSLGSAIFPKLSALKGDDLLHQSVRFERLLMVIMLPIIVVGIFAIGPFLTLWVGRDFAGFSAAAGQILMVGAWFDSMSRIPLYALRAQSRPELVAKVDLVQVVPYWIVLYCALTYFGLVGVAAAYVFRVAMNYVLLDFELGTLRRSGTMLAICSLVLGFALMLSRSTAAFSPLWMAGLVGCLAIATVLGFYGTPADLRKALLARIGGRTGA